MPGIDFRRKEAEWMQFVNMIREECPHCLVENLVVVDGAAWGYTYIDFTEVRPREALRAGPGPADRLSPDWQWFIRKCQKLGDGIIAEVHFRDGNPITIRGVKTAMGRFARPIGGDTAEPRRAPAFA